MKKRQINDEMMDSVLNNVVRVSGRRRTKDIKRDRRIKQIRWVCSNKTANKRIWKNQQKAAAQKEN